MTAQDEARTLRSWLDRLERVVDRLDRPSTSATHTVVLQTATQTTYPTAARRFYACHVVKVSGVEAEDEVPTLAAVEPFVYAMNVGTTIPPEGTFVVAGLSQGRHVFQFDGAEE